MSQTKPFNPFPKIMEYVQAISSGGRKLCPVPLDQAHEMIRLGEAKGHGTKQRIRLLEVFHAPVISQELPGGTPRTFYRDDIGDGHHVGTLKRHISGSWHRWHPDLTFADVRAGRNVPEAVALARAEARRFARNG